MGFSADEEYDECLLKARVLAAERPDFELLETMLWRPRRESSSWTDILNAWLAREYFGFAVDLESIEHSVTTTVAALPSQPHRLRLLVDQNGLARLEAQPLPDALDQHPVRIGLAPQAIDRQDVFFYHKTTRREAYEAALRSRPECDDVLLWNERGEITETCLANVAVRLDGALVTPPVDCGLLAGTLRGWLLERGSVAGAGHHN